MSTESNTGRVAVVTGDPLMAAAQRVQDELGGADVLVNISSVAGRTARAGNAAYAATKWA
jgi:NADP-dependent 3-hydroxy acid dehydrogenase YdfG